MNHIVRYGLSFNPFVKTGKESLIETSEYKEVVFRLDYLMQVKGFGVITGDPGLGKTTAVINWVNTLSPNSTKVIYLPLSTLSVNDAYRQLCLSFNCEPHYKKSANFAEIQSAIRRLSLEKRITPVIIMDEANYMSKSFLNDLKMLFNFDMDSKDLAVVILIGQSSLNSMLSQRTNEAIRQRIITSYNMEGLNQDETIAYIKKKLKSADCHIDIFNDNALKAISSYCHGNPRLISKLCNTALLLGDTKSVSTIDEDIIMSAINELEL